MRIMKIAVFTWLCDPCSGLSPKASAAPLLTEDHLKIAKICRDVYSERVETLDIFVESRDTGVQATVDMDGNRAIVCLRGSNSVIDWKHNFKFGKEPFLSRKHSDPAKKVHSGFFIGHNSVKAKIYRKLNALIDAGGCERILFTGHSAGLTSSLLAYDFVNEKDLPIEIVTFGTPRLGNKAFADDFDSKMNCTRIVNDNDLIPLAPLEIMGFRHVGNKLIHMKDSVVTTEDPRNTQRFLLWLRGLICLDAGVEDHSMDSYVEEIEKCLKNDVPA